MEFAAPVGYVEPEVVRPKQSLLHEEEEDDAIDYEGMRNAQNQFKVSLASVQKLHNILYTMN